MRGLYTATLLNILNHRLRTPEHADNVDLGKSFDLICGTSTGAILACGLAAGVPLGTVIDLYKSTGPQIFPNPLPSSYWRELLWAICHRRRSSACADSLRNLLEEIFPTETIGSLYKDRGIGLCIPAVNADTHRAWVFKTSHLPGKHRDEGYRLSDVCLASAAAPIFFPLAKIRNPITQDEFNAFVDGGLWANNPILIGLLEALQILVARKEDRAIQIISIGTINTPAGDPEFLEKPDIGILDWKVGMNIVDMSIAAQGSGFTFMAKLMADALNRKNHSIEIIRLPEKPKSAQHLQAIGLDRSDPRALRTLFQLAQEDADAIHSDMMAGNEEHYGILKEIIQTAGVREAIA